jgi:hypothetical protein
MGICSVQVDDPRPLFHGNVASDAFHQIAMRVYEGKAATDRHVLMGHCLEERRFTDACLPNDIAVGKPIDLTNADQGFFVAEIRSREIRDVGVGARSHASIIVDWSISN